MLFSPWLWFCNSVNMSFLGVAAARSRRSDDRSASPGARIDAAADILAELRVLERDEEDDSYSLLDGASVGGSIPRDIPVHQARDRQPRSAAAGSGGNGGEFSFATPLQHGSRRLLQSGGVDEFRSRTRHWARSRHCVSRLSASKSFWDVRAIKFERVQHWWSLQASRPCLHR